MAPPVLWQLLLAVFALNILVFPTLTTGLRSDDGIDYLGAHYTRTIRHALNAVPQSTWSSTLSSAGFLTSDGLSPSAINTGSLGDKTSVTTLTLVRTSFVTLPAPWMQTTRASASSPLMTSKPSGDLTRLSLTTASQSAPEVPVNTPWSLTPDSSSQPTSGYSTWLTSVTSLPSDSSFLPGTLATTSNLSKPITWSTSASISPFESVVTSTETANGTAAVTSFVVTFLPPLSSSGSTPSPSHSESSITSTITVNGSAVVTILPPSIASASSGTPVLGSSDLKSTATVSRSAAATSLSPLSSGASSMASGLASSEVKSTTTASGSGSVVFTNSPPLTASASSSTPSLGSFEGSSTTVIDGSTIVTSIPPLASSPWLGTSGLSSFDLSSMANVSISTTVPAVSPWMTSASSSFGFISSEISSTIIANGSAIIVIPPQTASAPSATSGVSFSDVSSTTIVNGSSTIVVAIPPQTSAEASHSTLPLTSSFPSTSMTSGASSSMSESSASSSSATASIQTSTNAASSSSTLATNLPTPSAPTPNPTASSSSDASQSMSSTAESMQSDRQTSTLSTSTIETTFAPILITPIPIVLSESEKPSTKDPEKTKGTHSDSISKDKDGHLHRIHFPVLPGGCWFCPPGPPGFRLPELTLPGVYPPIKPPGPGWMSIPALTIDGLGNPTFESEPKPSASDPNEPASASARTTKSSESPSSSGSTSASESLSSQLSSLFSVASTATGSDASNLSSEIASVTRSASSELTSSSVSASISESDSASKSTTSSETTSSSESTRSSQSTDSPRSSSGCATTTTEVCSTLTSYGVDVSSSTTATRTTSTCTPTIGCSVTASNTATATTASASSGCWEYDFKLDDQAFESEDEQSYQEIDPEAGANGFNHVGGCSFSRNEYDPARGSSTAIPILIRIATWPAATSLASSSDATEWYAATMASKTEGACPTLTYKKFDNVTALTASPVMTGVGGIPAMYSLDGGKPSVNVDHAYDIPLIMEFLESIMAAQSDLASFCDSFNDFFIGPDPSYDGLPRLQKLFNDAANAYSSNYAVDSVLNDVKAKLLANLDGLRGGDDGTKQIGSTNVTMSDSEKLQVLNEIAAAIALINDEGVTSRFNMSNSAYWGGWMAIDDLGKAPGCSAAPLPPPSSGALGWADAYTNFMTSKLAQQNTAISEHIESIIATEGGWFTQTADEDGNLNLAGRGLEAFKAGYPSSMWTMTTAAMLDWDIQPSFHPLSPATCYTTPSVNIPDLLSSYSSLTAAESMVWTGTNIQLTSYQVQCADGETTSSCWEYAPLPSNSSAIGTVSSSFSTLVASKSTGSWSSNTLTPSPVPTPGSSLTPMTSSANFFTPTMTSFASSTSSSVVSSSSLLSSDSSSNTGASSSALFSDSGNSTTSESISGSSTSNSALSSSSLATHSTRSMSAVSSSATTKSSLSAEASSSSSSLESSSISSSESVNFTPTSSTLSSQAASMTTNIPAATTSAGMNNCNNFDQGSPAWNFDLDGAYRALDYVCLEWTAFKAYRSQNFSRQWGEPYENPIEIHIDYWGDGSSTSDGTPSCSWDETVDRSEPDYLHVCEEGVKFSVDQCDKSSNGFYWWKSGGFAVNYCWLFTINRGIFEALPDGYSHNDAKAADSITPTDSNYRPDSTCEGWQDCPKCPVENAQRKCDNHWLGYKYCTCKDPDPVSSTAAPSATAVPNSPAYTKLSCSNHEQGNPTESFDLDSAKTAIEYICRTWYEDPPSQTYLGIDFGSVLENPLHLHIGQNNYGGSCPNFYEDRNLALNTCRDDLSYLLNTCDTSDNGFYWWKSGGTLIKDCYEWALLRGEFNTSLESGFSRNDAKDSGDLTSDDYRPDSSCSEWQDCPKCPGDGWQRKCESDHDRPQSGACLCYDPSSDSASVDAVSMSQNGPAPLQARSNITAEKSLAPAAHATVDSSMGTAGVLQCFNAAQGSPHLNFELNGANAAIEYACDKWAYSDALKFLPFHVDWSAPYEDPIELEMLYLGDRERSVARHFQGRRDTPYCSAMPRSADEFKDLCITNMQYIVNSCNTARNAHYWWKSGGARTNECWRWSISRGHFATLPVGYMHNDAVGADDYTGVPEYQDYRPDSWCTAWQQCPVCPLEGAQRKCRGDESEGPSYCLCKS